MTADPRIDALLGCLTPIGNITAKGACFDVRVLAVVLAAREQPSTIGQLGQRFGRGIATTTAWVAFAVGAGLVETTKSPLDLRQTHVALTPKGARFCARMNGARDDRHEPDLSDGERGDAEG